MRPIVARGRAAFLRGGDPNDEKKHEEREHGRAKLHMSHPRRFRIARMVNGATMAGY